MKNKLSNNTKTTWLFIIGTVLIFLAVIVWYWSSQKLQIMADVYVPEVTQTPTVSPSPPIPQPTVIIDTCQQKCEGKNYQTGTCREYPIIENPQICLDDETNIGVTEDCYVQEGIVGSGKACCCANDSPTSTPTAYTSPDVSDISDSNTDVIAYYNDPVVLVSTGASLWFNLLIAVFLAFAIGYLMFREDIWKKRK